MIVSETEIRDMIAVLMLRLYEAEGPMTGKQLRQGLVSGRRPLIERARHEHMIAEAFAAMRRAGSIRDVSGKDTAHWALTHEGRNAARELARRSA